MDLPVPTREGYNFKGWCFESTVSNDIDLIVWLYADPTIFPTYDEPVNDPPIYADLIVPKFVYPVIPPI